jgi:hypothetical protein
MGFLDIITSGILAVFSMFSQLIEYMASAPGYTMYLVLTNWGLSFKNFGIFIPLVFIMTLGITGVVAYTLIEMAESMNDIMDVANLEIIPIALGSFQFQNIIHATSLNELTYIITKLGNTFIQGLLMIFDSLKDGIVEGFSSTIDGILNAVGIPFSYWSVSLPVNYMLPVVFVIILGFTLLILLAFIDAMGYEKDIAEGIKDLSEMEL